MSGDLVLQLLDRGPRDRADRSRDDVLEGHYSGFSDMVINCNKVNINNGRNLAFCRYFIVLFVWGMQLW